MWYENWRQAGRITPEQAQMFLKSLRDRASVVPEYLRDLWRPEDAAEGLEQFRRHPLDDVGSLRVRKYQASQTPTSEKRNPARDQFGDMLISSLMAAQNPSSNGNAYFVAGLPGSGKNTWLESSGILKPQQGALLVDSDHFKQYLPEYAGGYGAGVVHNESSNLGINMLGQAVDNGHDFAYPVVANDYERTKRFLGMLKDNGYKTHLRHIKIPQDEAMRRIQERFRNTGRFVPPEYLESVGDGTDTLYDQARHLPFDSAEQIDYRDIKR